RGHDPRFEFEALFEAQVESHQRDISRDVGKYLFTRYRESGALNNLLLDMQEAVNEPRFEVEVRGVIGGRREGVMQSISGVTFLGKPDVFYINQFGASVIVDWKVNGYYSKRKIYPMRGYLRHYVPAITGEVINDPFNQKHVYQFHDKGRHKECYAGVFNGTIINLSLFLEDMNDDWATQLSVYSWLCGTQVGDQFIVGIDQICCAPIEDSLYPEVSFAEHRLRVRTEYQHSIWALAQEIWQQCNGDHFFKELSKEESQARCQILDERAKQLFPEDDDFGKAFMEMTKVRRAF